VVCLPFPVFLGGANGIVLPCFTNINHYLVGGFNPSEKYQSVGIIIQNMWKNKTCYDYNISLT
jgi:hypothetical protein